MLSKKIRLLFTPEQEKLAWKSAGTSRWIWNQCLAAKSYAYNDYGTNISTFDLRKAITKLKTLPEYSWLKEVAANVAKQSVKDLDIAYQRFFKGTADFPKFKKKFKKTSFYVNYESFHYMPNGCYIEKFKFVRTAEPLPKCKKYHDTRVSFDGKYWYVAFGYDENKKNFGTLTDISLGIDLGIKNLAICSDGTTYKNINKTKVVRRLKKKLRREQRKQSRRQENNVQSRDVKGKITWKRPLKECKNFGKQKLKIKLLYRRLKNIRQNYLHQVTTEIVKTKPSRIVIENLNVQGMMKNKHLADSVQEQKFYEFRRLIEYKSKLCGIEIILADRFYASSKTCSHCGHLKTDLKLSDRIYKCSECGLTIDRDLNAAINLANYKV